MKAPFARQARFAAYVYYPAALLALGAVWFLLEAALESASAQAPGQKKARALITPLPPKAKPGQPGKPLQPLQPIQPAPGAGTNTPLLPPPAPPPQPRGMGQTPTQQPLEHPESVAPYHPKGLTLFFLGMRNSEIEPCGCVKNQLGGIQYEATLYEAAKREESLRVDVGGWNSRGATPEAAMKSVYALRAMGGFLDFDAVNVGQADLDLGKLFFENLLEKDAAAADRLVSANIFYSDDPEKPAFHPYRISERKTVDGKSVRCAIVGLSAFAPSSIPGQPVSLSDRDFKIEPPAEAIGRILAELKDKADLKVVLFHGNWPEATALAEKFQDIDVIVCVNQAPDYQKKFMFQGRTLMLGNYSALGKQLGRADLVQDAKGVWIPTEPPGMLGVSPKALKARQEMVDLINQYKKQTEELIAPVPNDAKKTFAGVHTCTTCHVKEYNQWLTTGHSHALQTLVAKGSQFDGECLKCHTVGYKTDNGFYNVRQSRHMGNVQCENCHGPAQEHVQKQNLIANRSIESMVPAEREKFLAEAKAALPKKDVGEETCVKCHYGENDPHFEFDKYIPKVSHKSVAASEPAAPAANPAEANPSAPNPAAPAPPAPPGPAASKPADGKPLASALSLRETLGPLLASR